MSAIPIVIIIIKLALSFGLIVFGIRCTMVDDPKRDDFVFDIRNLIKIKGMSRKRFWKRNGFLLILLGILLAVFLFVL